MIRAVRITKRFDRVEAVSEVSFDLDAGGAMALWGSNGAGKTTLIRCLLGVIRWRGSASVGASFTCCCYCGGTLAGTQGP